MACAELGPLSPQAPSVVLPVLCTASSQLLCRNGRASLFGERSECGTVWSSPAAGLASASYAVGYAAHNKVTAVLVVFLLGMVPTILVPMLQTRLMDVAHEGQSLAAALNHSTLNMANALGAWLGSVVLEAGYGYEWPSRVGVVLALAPWASPRSRCSSAGVR